MTDDIRNEHLSFPEIIILIILSPFIVGLIIAVKIEDKIRGYKIN